MCIFTLDNAHIVQYNEITKEIKHTIIKEDLKMKNKKWTATDIMQMGIKKTFIDWEPLPTLSAYTGEPDTEFELFRGLDASIDGGWLACSNGEPVGEGVLYDDEGQEIIDAVHAILDDESAPWYDIDEEDAEYLAEYFEIWQAPHPNM